MPLLVASAISGGISLGMGAYKAYQGSKQEQEGRDAMKRIVTPEYQIPDEIKQNLKESELRALEGMPSAQKKDYIQNIERSQQQQLQASADRKGGLLGIQSSAQQATDAFTNLVSMDAQARAENQQKLQQNRLIMAQEKQKQFDIKEGRYQQSLASAQGMIGAGMQNKMSGIDQMAASALQAGSTMVGLSAMKTGGAATQTPQQTINPEQLNVANDLNKSVGKYGYLVGRQ